MGVAVVVAVVTRKQLAIKAITMMATSLVYVHISHKIERLGLSSSSVGSEVCVSKSVYQRQQATVTRKEDKSKRRSERNGIKRVTTDGDGVRLASPRYGTELL